MKTENNIKKCTDYVIALIQKIAVLNSLHYYDINTSSENFFKRILNLVYGWKLSNLNEEKMNATAIDLYDDKSKIAVQVTSDDSAGKIHETITKYIENKYQEKYDRLVFLVMVMDKNYTAEFDKDKIVGFDKKRDIITCQRLIEDISKLEPEKIQEITNYFEFELETALDKNYVWSISDAEEYMKGCTNGNINLDYFEIDDKDFVARFDDEINSSKNIFIKGYSREETIYCILNQLRKSVKDKPIYIIKNEETWIKASEIICDSIVIPYFQADEIVAIKHNVINIFVYGVDSNAGIRNYISLRRRKISTLQEKLKNNGYEDAYSLIRKANGIFPFVKRAVFNGQPSNPVWAEENSTAVITALLIGQWHECEGDIAVIEELSGMGYEEFINTITSFSKTDTPLIIRSKYYDSVSYEIADIELTWSFMHEKVDAKKKEQMLELTKKIILDKDPIFAFPFEEHFLKELSVKKSMYSKRLKEGLIRSLIFIAINIDQEVVDRCLCEVLENVSSLGDWGYISQYMTGICEASPKAFLDKLEKSIGSDDFINLFTANGGDWIAGRHYYPNVLWAIESLYRCQEYVFDAADLLMQMAEKIDKCSTGNNPRDSLSVFYCTWLNVSSVSVDRKIELATKGIEKYDYMWNLLYEELPSRRQSVIFARHTFDYRINEDVYETTNGDMWNQNLTFLKLLRERANKDVDRWVKLIELFPELSDELFDDLKNQLVSVLELLNDSEKEIIKTELRSMIHDHRYFKDSDWAMAEEYILKLESVLNQINFENPVYEYLYLTRPDYDIPILHPLSMEEDEARKQNDKQVQKLLENSFNEMRDKGVDICALIELRKKPEYTQLGKWLAQYYSQNKFDEQMFRRMVKIEDSEIVVFGYVDYLYRSESEIFTLALDICKENEKLYTRLLSIPYISDEFLEFIDGNAQNVQKNYFSSKRIWPTGNETWLYKVIDKYIELGLWRELVEVVYKIREVLSLDEIIKYLDIFVKIPKERAVGDHESYQLKRIIERAQHLIWGTPEKYMELIPIELVLYKVVDWDGMRCTQHMFCTNASTYADVLKYIFKTDEDEDVILTKEQQELASKLYGFYTRVKFCPGVINGIMEPAVLKKWVEDFRVQLNAQSQNTLFSTQIGKLFAYSVVGTDGCMPHEAVRDLIEKYYDDDLRDGYAMAEFNKRGVHTVSDGESEKQLALSYKDNANKIRIKHPKTARIYDLISKNYFSDSVRERERAENGRW